MSFPILLLSKLNITGDSQISLIAGIATE